MRLWRERWRAFWKGVSVRQIRAISKAYRDLRGGR